MKIVVIGAFECPERAPFPSHVPPILAEHGPQGFRRAFYDMSFNIVDTPGEDIWVSRPQDILPNISVIRTKPRKYDPGDQVVYLGNSTLIVTHKKFYVLLHALPHIFSRRFSRAVQTIANAYS